jgi:hypothetical protein
MTKKSVAFAKELKAAAKKHKKNNTATQLRKEAVAYNKAMRINKVNKKSAAQLHSEYLDRVNLMKKILKV